MQTNATFSVVISTKNRWRAPKLGSLKFPCCRLVTNEQYVTSSRVMIHMIAANQPLHWLSLFHGTTSEKSRILFVQPAMLMNRTILSLDQRIEVMCRLSEAHHVERLLPRQCGKTQMARMISKQTRRATVAYVAYKHSRTVGLQYLSCYVTLILGISLVVIIVGSIAIRCIIFGVPHLPIRPCDERPSAMYGHFCLIPRVSVHDRYYCSR